MEDHIRKFREGGRGRELRSLEKLYNREGFTFAVIYGRRRVGKTSLINEFIRRDNKKAIQFTATENTNAVNLSNFSKSIFSVFPRPPSLGGLPSWEGAFDYVVEQAKEEKIILAIDEYPYLVKAYPSLFRDPAVHRSHTAGHRHHADTLRLQHEFHGESGAGL
ncbi:MAG: ATP-binding protein [Methanomassiliicoccaceae archaeon]|nr:ATP-binding protein [Methanomassiliicoccaceae archaeon]